METIKTRFHRINRAVQTGLAVVLAVMGALLALAFLLNPALVLAGERPLEGILHLAGALGVSWLQWRYRLIVYLQLRRGSLAASAACVLGARRACDAAA